MKTVITFGEIMLRLSPSENGERLTQATQFRVEIGGSESNVAIAISNLGYPTRFVSKLPNNELTEKAIQSLRMFDVDTSFILKEGDKIGIYWTENGIGPRNSFVIYDRDHTSFSKINMTDFEWDNIFKDSCWFHFSGISPAISENVNNVLLDVIEKIKVPYSVDLNYRAKLWKWVNKNPSEISRYMSDLCNTASLIAGNEVDFQEVLGIRPLNLSPQETFNEIAENCFNRFPNLKYISISNRESISATTNIWNSYLFVKGNEIDMYVSAKYRLENIIDRVGTGDSFVAGIIFGIINKPKYSYQEIIDFATTLAALNHTTQGDASRYTEEEVWKVMQSNGNGRIVR